MFVSAAAAPATYLTFLLLHIFFLFLFRHILFCRPLCLRVTLKKNARLFAPPPPPGPSLFRVIVETSPVVLFPRPSSCHTAETPRLLRRLKPKCDSNFMTGVQHEKSTKKKKNTLENRLKNVRELKTKLQYKNIKISEKQISKCKKKGTRKFDKLFRLFLFRVKISPNTKLIFFFFTSVCS